VAFLLTGSIRGLTVASIVRRQCS